MLFVGVYKDLLFVKPIRELSWLFQKKTDHFFEAAARCKVVCNFNPFWSLVPADWFSESKALEAKEL